MTFRVDGRCSILCQVQSSENSLFFLLPPYPLFHTENEKMPNKPVDLIPAPSGLSAYLLLNPLRGQEECRKQAGIAHWGRSINI